MALKRSCWWRVQDLWVGLRGRVEGAWGDRPRTKNEGGGGERESGRMVKKLRGRRFRGIGHPYRVRWSPRRAGRREAASRKTERADRKNE